MPPVDSKDSPKEVVEGDGAAKKASTESEVVVGVEANQVAGQTGSKNAEEGVAEPTKAAAATTQVSHTAASSGQATTDDTSTMVPLPVTIMQRASANTRPGAISVSGRGAQNNNNVAMDNLAGPDVEQQQRVASRPEEGLAVAQTVPGGDLEDAVPVEDGQDHHKQLQKRQRQKLIGYGIFGVLAMICIVAIVVVFAVVAPNRAKNANNTDDSSQTPTTIDGVAPREKLMSLLPDSTIPFAEYNDTPQGKAFEWVLQDANFVSYSDKRLQQRFALATFWYSTNGEVWGPDWLEVERHECNWVHFMPTNTNWYKLLVTRYAEFKYIEGPCVPGDPAVVDGFPQNSVDVEEKNRTFVSATEVLEHEDYLYLGMERQDLTGELPEELVMLSSLKVFQLDHSTLTGSIPGVLSRMTTLEELLMYKTSLTGTIPASFGKLTELRTLVISGGKEDDKGIRGPCLPSELGLLTHLRTLNIFETRCSGSIPTELMNLNPYEMQLAFNELTGTIPSEMGFMTNLDYLSLDKNYLSGTLSTELGNLKNMWLLYMFQNEFTGTIPSEFGNFMSGVRISGWNGHNVGGEGVEQLYLNSNRLTGTIPTELAPTINSVWRLKLEANLLTGVVPSELGKLTKLKAFGVPNNTLTGPIPSEVAAMPDILFFAVSDNQFTGTLPRELFEHSNLRGLFVENNRFSGALPTEIGVWQALEELRLSNNTFSGTIPSEIGSLQSLEILFLDSNNFTGQLPADLGLLIVNGSLTTLNLTNNGFLSGEIPDVFCNWRFEPNVNNALAFDCGPVCGCECLCDVNGDAP